MNLIEKFTINNAAKNASVQKLSKEFKTEFCLIIGFKLFLSVISILTSFAFINGLCKPLLHEFSIVCAAMALMFIEFFNFTLPAKTFKMLFRIQIKAFICLLPFVVALFMLSFFLSTNGIEETMQEKTSKETEINKDYSIQKEELKKEYDLQIKEAETAYKTAKDSYTWKGKIAAFNLKKIEPLRIEVKELRKVKKQALQDLKQDFKGNIKTDSKQSSDIGKYYFKGVAVLLIVQLILSIIHSFLSVKIFKDEKPDKMIVENIKQQQNEFKQKTIELIERQNKQIVMESLQLFDYSQTALKDTLQDSEISTEKQSKKGFENWLKFTGQKLNNKAVQEVEKGQKLKLEKIQKSNIDLTAKPDTVPLTVTARTEAKEQVNIKGKNIEVNDYLKANKKIVSLLCQRVNNIAETGKNKPTLQEIADRANKSLSHIKNVKRIFDNN